MKNEKVLTLVDKINKEVKLSPDKVYFLSHPCTSGGYGEKANRVQEEEVYQFLVSKCKDIKVIRPLKIIPAKAGYDEAMERSFRLMELCDVFIFAPGWESSKGCNEENYICFKHDYKTAYFGFKDFSLGGDHMDINSEKQNCFRCIQRDANFCMVRDKFLTLVNVEENVLIFQDQEDCTDYIDRRDI